MNWGTYLLEPASTLEPFAQATIFVSILLIITGVSPQSHDRLLHQFGMSIFALLGYALGLAASLGNEARMTSRLLGIAKTSAAFERSNSMFGWRFWGLSLVYALGSGLFIGIPTVLIPNLFFRRMTPTSVQDYLIWAISSALLGVVLALAMLYPTTSLPSSTGQTGSWRMMTGTLLSVFSVGCPICNKLVVLLLGLGGAMTVFNPLRPFLGIASIALLSVTLFLRVRVAQHGCPISFDPTVSKKTK